MGNLKSKVKEEKNLLINELKDVNIKDGKTNNAVDKIVDDIMSSNEINITYLPDLVERQIYKNLIIYIFGIVEKVIKTTKIEFLNHEITFNITPKK